MLLRSRLLDKVIVKITKDHLQDTSVGTHNEEVRIKWLEQTLKGYQLVIGFLDAGAGEQPFKKLCTHLNYVSQDFAQYQSQESNVGLQMQTWDYGKLDIVSDVVAIPEPESSFDAIMCTEVFEHIPEPILAIKEFSRLLKSEGLLIITAPFCSLTHFAPHHYYTGFNKYFYEKHLSENDFKIIEISANGNYFEYLAQEIRRIPAMADTYALEKLSNLEKLAIKVLLKMLDRFSVKDRQSTELLNFGYHILAKRI